MLIWLENCSVQMMSINMKWFLLNFVEYNFECTQVNIGGLSSGKIFRNKVTKSKLWTVSIFNYISTDFLKFSHWYERNECFSLEFKCFILLFLLSLVQYYSNSVFKTKFLRFVLNAKLNNNKIRVTNEKSPSPQWLLSVGGVYSPSTVYVAYILLMLSVQHTRTRNQTKILSFTHCSQYVCVLFSLKTKKKKKTLIQCLLLITSLHVRFHRKTPYRKICTWMQAVSISKFILWIT